MRQVLPSLQAYRGLAAIVVVLFHANLAHFGYSGVDLFFVLSGFIIHHIHQLDLGEPGRVGPYAVKRFVRIYPLYFLTLLVRLSLLMSSYSTTDRIGKSQIVRAFFLVPEPPPGPIISVSWTLSYEVFFYLLFAGAIVSPRRLSRALFVGWVAALVAALAILDFDRLPFWAQFVLNFHNLEFALGILAAALLPVGGSSRGRAAQIAGVLGYGVVALLTTRYMADDIHRFDILYGIASAVIIWGAAAADTARPPAWPSLLLFLGNASYSIYLVHATLVFNAQRQIAKLHPGPLADVGLKLLAAAAAVAVGAAVHLAVEKPLLALFRKKGKVAQDGKVVP